jgi:hypothetical protein
MKTAEYGINRHPYLQPISISIYSYNIKKELLKSNPMMLNGFTKSK